MKLDKLKEYYRACDPDETLDPDDSRNIDVDVASDTPVRGRSWAARLERRIVLAGENPVCLFFSGLIGSGKSTELRRLAKSLRENEKLLPIIVDSDELLDRTRTVDVPDVMIALVYGTERRLCEAEGNDPEKAMRDGYITRIWNWLNDTDIELAKVEVGVSSTNFALEMKTRENLRQRVRTTVSLYLTSFLELVEEEFRGFDRRARALGWTGIVVILDSLEKLRGSGDHWRPVLESAERLFADRAPYLQLPVHVLYTVPPSVFLRLKVEELEFLPMIKLHERNGAPYDPGYLAARDLVRRRLPDPALRELLGTTSMEARVRRLIHASGGYPREIVRLLKLVLIAYESTPLSEKAFNRVLHDAADAFERMVLGNIDSVDWLAQVAVHKKLLLDDAHREAADHMISNNVVLRYMNDEDWFDLHPSVKEIEEVKRAMGRLIAAEEKRG